MTKLFLLQSGFVTPNATYLVKEDDHDLSIRDKLYLADTRILDNTSYYDENIEKLFKLYHKDNSIIKQFEFRNEVLEAAFRVFKFGSASILPWIRIQLTQRTVGFLHRKYLKETLAFAGMGAAREMENYTYYRLLKNDVNGPNFQTGKEDPDALLKDFVSDGDTVNLIDIIGYWTADTARFIDLLVTLNVIFGRRPEQKTSRMPA